MPRPRLGSLIVAPCLAAFLRTTTAQAQAPAPESVSNPAVEGPGPSPTPPAVSRDVVLLDAPERLDRALRAALSPWGMRVERMVRPKPIPTLPGTAQHAGALARELGAKVLVWLSSNEDGAALWIYETSKDTITVRPFPDKPLDQALAAALALSVKTWLRTSDLRSEPPVQDQDIAEPSLEPPVDAAPLERPTLRVPAAAPPPIVERVAIRVLIRAAARHGAFQPTAFETRYGADLRLSPWWSDAGTSRLWLGARVDLGEPHDVENAKFRGIYSEWGGGLSAGFEHRFAEALGVALHVGATLSWASLSGTLKSDSSAAERGELGAAAEVTPELDLSFGSFGIVVQPTLAASLRGERFTADRVEVVETRPVWWVLGGAVRFNVL